MKFTDIPFHDEIKARLREIADSGRIPHAILLEGPSGSAKFALARAFAQYLHCTNRRNGDSCGECPSCRQHTAHQHIDTLYSFPYVKKGSGGVTICDDFRQDFTRFMDEQPWMDFDLWPARLGDSNTQPQIFVDEAAELMRRAAFTSHSAKHKIILMWLPERLREEAANKMLKIVEEPFADTVFVMASDNSREILPTIYSRVQRIKVRRYEDSEVAAFLESRGVDGDTSQQIAAIAGGDLNRALSLLKTKDEDDQYLEWFIQLMRLAYMRDIAALKSWSTKVAGEKREALVRFLEYCCRMLRENFILNLHNPVLNRMTGPESKFSTNFSRFVNERNVLRIFDEFTAAIRDIRANVNAKIVMFDLSISVILLLKQ